MMCQKKKKKKSTSGLLMELQRANKWLCAVRDNRPDEVFILTVALMKIGIPQLSVNSVSTHCLQHVRGVTLEESERQDKLLSVIIS